MSDELKAAAERCLPLVGTTVDLENAPIAFLQDIWALAQERLALGERQEDRWTHQRDSDGALSMFMFPDAAEAAGYFAKSEGGRIVRVSTFVREEGGERA